MPKYVILCPSCNSEFTSYEKYIGHVFEKHQDQPSLRMQAKVIKKEIDEGSADDGPVRKAERGEKIGAWDISFYNFDLLKDSNENYGLTLVFQRSVGHVRVWIKPIQLSCSMHLN